MQRTSLRFARSPLMPTVRQRPRTAQGPFSASRATSGAAHRDLRCPSSRPVLRLNLGLRGRVAPDLSVRQLSLVRSSLPPRSTSVLHGGRAAPPASPLADRSSSDGGSHRASIGTSASADHPGSLHARRSSRRPGPSSASHPHGAHVVRASSPQLSFRCLTPACSGLAALRTARR